MISAVANDPIEPSVWGAPSGLAGQITAEIVDPLTDQILATTGVIHESAESPGTYTAFGLIAPVPGTGIKQYLVVWKGTNTSPNPVEELIVRLVALPVPGDYVPSVAQVGALLRARTLDPENNELGTFTAATRPTQAQAEELINQAAGIVSLAIGDVIPAALESEAGYVVALLAAMLIELSYFPEQVASGRSPYAQYKELFDAAIGTPAEPGSLVLAVRNALDDGTVDVEPGPGRASFGGFPTGGGWMTRVM